MIKDILKNEHVKEIFTEVNSFCYNSLDNYIKEIEKTPKIVFENMDKKDVHDAVWGTIGVSGHELIILDSPLMQRMRFIKNLGLAYLLFPQADYSRFAHTLGTVFISDRISRKMNEELNNDKSKVEVKLNGSFPITFTAIIRLAAIFHDVGHMFCSHASENYYESVMFTRASEIRKLKNAFVKGCNTPNIKLSVILSILILNSDSVKQLFKLTGNCYSDKLPKEDKQIEQLIEYISCFILGIPRTVEMLPYCQSISGAVDADRLDYLIRDSYCTNIPIAVDIFRIIQKIRKIGIKDSNINLKLFQNYTRGKELNAQGLAYSGLNTLEQLMMSRAFMYENIYYHQKVVTAEQMLRDAIKILDYSNCELISNFTYILEITDNMLINKHCKKIIEGLYDEKGIDKGKDNASWELSYKLFMDLDERRLLKRCYMLYDSILMDHSETGEDKDFEVMKLQKEFTGFLNDHIINPKIDDKGVDKQAIFLGKLKEEYDRMLQLLEIEDDVKPEFAFINPRVVKEEDIQLFIEQYPKPKKYSEIFQGNHWRDSRGSRKKVYFICSKPNHRYLMNIAIEKILYKEFDECLIFENQIFTSSEMKHINATKKRLMKSDYFYNAIDLIPDEVFCEEYLNTVHESDLEIIGDKIKAYQHNGKDDSLVKYLKQFLVYKHFKKLPNDNFKKLIEGQIKILKDLKLCKAKDIIDDFIMPSINDIERECGKELKVCYLGNAQDGGSHMSYYFNGKDGISVKKIEEVIKVESYSEKEQAIVLVEDAFFSGSQMISMFQTLLGVPLEKRMTDEIHTEALNEDCRKKLINSEIHLIFAFANKDKIAFLEDNFKELGFENISIHYRDCFKDKYLLLPHQSLEEVEIAIISMKEIGGMALRSAKTVDGELTERWNDERISNSSLGYNDSQQLIVFEWNCPTYTMTALWQEGEVCGGYNWKPLFRRTRK